MKLSFIICLIFISVPLFALEPQIGFVWHYPYEDNYTQDLDGLGVNVMNSRIPWCVFEPEEGKYDFSTLEQQLETARKYNFRLILIIEFNPFCKPVWLYEKCLAADEVTMQYDGQPGFDNMPSLNSPICREAQEKLLQKLTEYLKEHDKQHTVIGYEAGVEWWHFAACRYNRLDTARFKNWLQNKYSARFNEKDTGKYSAIEELNTKWGTEYNSFDDIEVPSIGVNIGGEGTVGTGNVYVQVKEPRNIAWYNNEPEPYNGKKLTFTANADNRNISGMGSFVTIAWFEKGSYIPIASSTSEYHTGAGEKILTVTSDRPENAVGFSIYMLLVGYGNVKWSNVHITGDDGEIVFPASRIVFDPRTKTEDLKGAYSEGVWTISTEEYDSKNVSPAAVYDYQEFWQDMSAEYLNSLAAMVKKYDKSRFLMSFLTHSFSMSAEWDYNINAGFVPSKVFAKGRDLDILGMQLVGAEGDPYRIAAGMDLARKYNKPLCNIDLMDFNGGVYIPIKQVKQMAHTSIMHGTDHIIFCNYEGPKELSYRPDYPVEEIKGLLDETKIALESVKGYKPQPKTCIINPFILPTQNSGNDSRSFMGWYKIMEDRQIECDVLTFDELPVFDLAKYECILLPDAPYMTAEAYGALSRYKGCLLAVKGAGRYDELGNERKELKTDNIIYTEDYGKQFAGEAARHRRAGDTPAMMQISELKEDQLQGLRQGIKVLSAMRREPEVKTSLNSRVMRMYDKSGNMLVYVMNTSGEENTVLSATDAKEIITEKGKSRNAVFESFCILKY